MQQNQENTHAKVWYQQSCFAALLKSLFGMAVLKSRIDMGILL